MHHAVIILAGTRASCMTRLHIHITSCNNEAWNVAEYRWINILLGRLCNSEAHNFLNFSSCTYTVGKIRQAPWLCDFATYVTLCVLGELLWEALEEKCNGVTLSVQGGKPWIMWDESEPERRIRVSQWVTRRWGCLLPWVQGKFSRIALGKLEKRGWGRKKIGW